MSDKPPFSFSSSETLRAICENIAFGRANGYYPGDPPVLPADERTAKEAGAMEH